MATQQYNFSHKVPVIFKKIVKHIFDFAVLSKLHNGDPEWKISSVYYGVARSS